MLDNFILSQKFWILIIVCFLIYYIFFSLHLCFHQTIFKIFMEEISFAKINLFALSMTDLDMHLYTLHWQ